MKRSTRLALLLVHLAAVTAGCAGSTTHPDPTVATLAVPNQYVIDTDQHLSSIAPGRTVKVFLVEEEAFAAALQGDTPFAAELAVRGVTATGSGTQLRYTVPAALRGARRILVALVILDPTDPTYADYGLIGATRAEVEAGAALGKLAIGYAYDQTFFEPTRLLEGGRAYSFLLTALVPQLQSRTDGWWDTSTGPAPHPQEGVLARKTAYGARIGYGQEAVLINNVWNPAGALGAFSSSVYLRQGEIFGWQWSSDRANQVVAYPELLFGESAWWGLATTPALPIAMGSKAVTADFRVATEADGVYDTSFDIWVSSTLHPSPADLTHEIMIWNDRKGTLFFPAGAVVDRVQLGGVAYDVYVNPEHHGLTQYTWKYIAFLPEHPLVEGPLELTLFFDYLLSSGLVPSDSYLSSIEFGTEVVVGTGTTEVSGFAIDVH
jgi:hypothetical protein